MDSNGNMYLDEAARKALEEAFGEDAAKGFQPTPALETEMLGIDNMKVAYALSRLNHKARQVYFSERRRGASEEEALGAAEQSYSR